VTLSVRYYKQMFKCQSRRDDGKVSVSGFVLVVLVFAALMVMTFAGSALSQVKDAKNQNVGSDVSVIKSSQVWY